MNLPLNVDLKDKVAVVTGGGGVLCGSFAEALAECGAKVAVLDLRLEAAQAVADKIVEAGGDAIGVAANVLELDSLREAEKQVIEKYGVCDILINGAGGNSPKCTAQKEEVTSAELQESLEGSFFGFDTSGIDFVFSLNYSGTVNTCLVFGESMAKAGKGNILNVSSMSSYHPMTKVMAYSNAKAAINNFTEWLACHLAPAGLRVNAIAPGFFLTKQNEQLLMGDNNTPTPRCAKILANTPQNRLGNPEDLLGGLLYLVDDKAAGFVNGIVLAIDGGFNAYSGV